ncbi:ATP-binding protein [Desulfonatronum thiodismutans]|uniref:ATP-binding protein n=1 Tax=Desulfonatronum thiodismutans TaxID=159290 RepID=UPI0004ABDD7C|nr:ATP-binding protein [Desulfonatronum thiodismutans]
MQLFDVVSLAFPSNTKLIPVVGAAVREYALQSGFSATDSQRICLAFEEASTYSISLGFGREDDLLRVRLSRTTLGLHIVLRSRGLPLEDEALPAFDAQRFASAEDVTGLQTFLARHMVDEVTFSLLEGGERVICLVKHGPGNQGEQDKEQEKRAAPRKSSAGSSKPRIMTSHAVRLGQPDDAEGIARLALRAHGAVFFNESIYYPARVREMLEQGEMVSVVAETASGELMGHCALVADTPGARVRELTYFILDTRFKSPGVHEDVYALLSESARTLGLRAMSALAVTNHIHSQRNLLLQGFKECAMLLAAGPASRIWREKDGQDPGRIASVVFLNYLHGDDGTLLHVPDRHRPMVSRIFQHLGRNYRFSDVSGRGLPEGLARIYSESDLKEGWTWISVAQYGHDILKHVGDQLALSCGQGIPVAHLALPLADPATGVVADLVEKMGFFFAGVGLDDDGAEVLLVQYIHGVDPGYDSIHLASPFGRGLLEYARAADPGTWSDPRP